MYTIPESLYNEQYKSEKKKKKKKNDPKIFFSVHVIKSKGQLF